MQCKKCGYEPTMAEIQTGSAVCPNCARIEAQRSTPIQAAPVGLSMNPGVKKAMAGYEGAHPVVVVDLQMSFNSMVWFMVKLALASIPAILILFFLFFVIGASVFGLSLGGAILGTIK